VMDSLNGDTSFLTQADPRLAEPFLVGFANAAVSVYWISFIVLAIAFVISWFVKSVPLRQKSAMQEAAHADAALLAESAAEMMGSMVEPGTAPGQIELEQAEQRAAKAATTSAATKTAAHKAAAKKPAAKKPSSN